LLSLTSEEVAFALLQLADEHKQNKLIPPQALLAQIHGTIGGLMDTRVRVPPKFPEVLLVIRQLILLVTGTKLPNIGQRPNVGFGREAKISAPAPRR
jgi:hypothetical protein